MTKCTECSAPWKTGTRICDRCGHRLEAVTVTDPATPPIVVPVDGAGFLLERMNDDLAVLANNPPRGGLASFLTGFFTVPTSGLAFLLVKGLEVFGRSGPSPRDVKLKLRQNIGKAAQQYGSDANIQAIVEKAKSQLAQHEDRTRTAGRSLVGGLAVGAFLSAIVVGIVLLVGFIAASSREAAAAEQARLALQSAAELAVKAKEEAVRLAAERAKAAHERYIATYTSKVSLGDAPGRRFAVMVAGAKPDRQATQNVVERLRERGAVVSGGFFTDAFVADGLFTKLAGGDSGDVAQLELSGKVDKILLVKEDMTVAQKTDLPVLTADVTLTFTVLAADGGAVLESFTLNGRGAGSERPAAESQAMDDALGQFDAQKVVTANPNTKEAQP